jgi:aspartate/tyrosine/aromatic aminotransferase
MKPPDKILGLTQQFREDPRHNKVNLSVGIYMDADGKPPVFSSVREAERLLLEKELPKTYFPIDGDPQFCRETAKLLFGEGSSLYNNGIAYVAQTVGASGALRVGAELLKAMGATHAYVSDPTWINHIQIFAKVGFEIGSYPYYNANTHEIDFDAMCDYFQTLPEKSVLILHASCHNPTGTDLTAEQWAELSKIIKKRTLIPFFDSAYQGLKEGIDEDVMPLRLFARDGHEFLVSNSYAKNFGLYGERAGALAIVTHSKERSQVVASNVKVLIRANYSSPPLQGARIVTTILSEPKLKKQWLAELDTVRQRLGEMRRTFVSRMQELGAGNHFDFIQKQSGLFSLLGLSEEQVLHLQKECAIFMPTNGRMNVAGLNSSNMEAVVQALIKTL